MLENIEIKIKIMAKLYSGAEAFMHIGYVISNIYIFKRQASGQVTEYECGLNRYLF